MINLATLGATVLAATSIAAAQSFATAVQFAGLPGSVIFQTPSSISDTGVCVLGPCVTHTSPIAQLDQEV